MYLTVNTEIWFNTSATALPTDSSWTKFTLTTPETVDLVGLNNGTLSQFANELKLATGTYTQVMLILADSTATLTALRPEQRRQPALMMKSITWIPWMWSHTVPLAVLNAAQGINISTSLTVAAATSSGFGAPTTSTSTTTSEAPASPAPPFQRHELPSGLHRSPHRWFPPPRPSSTSMATTRPGANLSARRPAGIFALNSASADLHDVESTQATSKARCPLSGVTTLTAGGLPDVQVRPRKA